MKTKLLTLLSLTLAIALDAQAGSATWSTNPSSGDWNTAANWMPNTVPNGLTDIATFDTSSITQVSNRKPIVLASIEFAPNASVFTISITDGGELEIGSGIENNSGSVQNFEVDGLPLGAPMLFFNSATAGTLTNYTVAGSVIYFRDTSSADNATFNNNNSVGGGEEFDDESSAGNAVFTNNDQGGVGFYYSSTAGHATFIDNPGEHSPAGGETGFHFSSNAGESTIINNGSTTNISGFGCATFEDSSNAADATIINNGSSVDEGTGGMTVFTLFSGAGDSTLIANGGTNGGGGGTIKFKLDSTGDTSRAQVFGNGSLSIVGHHSPGVAIGSLEGDGLVFLGNLNLSVGSNNLSTVFSGLIEEKSEGAVGALTKIGTGALILTGANTYTGGTTIEGGNLVVNNRTGSATGTGPVQVNAGRLGGPGTIAGSVVVGTGTGSAAVLVPRKRGGKPDTLTIQSQLTFNSDASYRCGLNTEVAKAGKIVANGIVINGARFSLLDCCGLSLRPGKVLTVLDNTSANPISGTFTNLPDGGTITVGNNTFQADYTGGDGNDLTLTVVP